MQNGKKVEPICNLCDSYEVMLDSYFQVKPMSNVQ